MTRDQIRAAITAEVIQRALDRANDASRDEWDESRNQQAADEAWTPAFVDTILAALPVEEGPTRDIPGLPQFVAQRVLSNTNDVCTRFLESPHGNAAAKTTGEAIMCINCGQPQWRHWLRNAVIAYHYQDQPEADEAPRTCATCRHLMRPTGVMPHCGNASSPICGQAIDSWRTWGCTLYEPDAPTEAP